MIRLLGKLLFGLACEALCECIRPTEYDWIEGWVTHYDTGTSHFERHPGGVRRPWDPGMRIYREKHYWLYPRWTFGEKMATIKRLESTRGKRV